MQSIHIEVTGLVQHLREHDHRHRQLEHLVLHLPERFALDAKVVLELLLTGYDLIDVASLLPVGIEPRGFCPRRKCGGMRVDGFVR